MFRKFAEGGVALAYLTFVAAVSEDQVEAIRKDAVFVLTPTLIQGVSHLLSYGIQVQPLGQVLKSVIDGGDFLNKDLWHPFRPPKFHLPFAVAQLTNDLSKLWNYVSDPSEVRDNWLTSEMNRLLAVMHHGADSGACIVTALDFPADHDRAKRVRLPWKPPTAEQGAPRRAWWKLW
jgi:hypothetical protein